MGKRFFLALLGMAAVGLAGSGAAARDSLGVFSDWGAFRDPGVPRCYAIATPVASRLERNLEPFASVGIWPKRQVRNQLHIRLSRQTASGSAISLQIGNRRFDLIGSGSNAWAKDRTMDAAIVAAMRSSDRMIVSARDDRGQNFSNNYRLAGAATAMDAAAVGCARLGP